MQPNWRVDFFALPAPDPVADILVFPQNHRLDRRIGKWTNTKSKDSGAIGDLRDCSSEVLWREVRLHPDELGAWVLRTDFLE
jgi:hypothetical protein